MNTREFLKFMETGVQAQGMKMGPTYDNIFNALCTGNDDQVPYDLREAAVLSFYSYRNALKNKTSFITIKEDREILKAMKDATETKPDQATATFANWVKDLMR